MSSRSKGELERWAADLGVEERHLTWLVFAGLAAFAGWGLLRHLRPAWGSLRPALELGGRIALTLALLTCLGALVAFLARQLAIRYTEQRRRTVLPLVPPGFDPSEAQLAAFVIQVHGFRQRTWRRWLDAPAAGFRVLMTTNVDGRPLYLWQLPRRHLRHLQRAAESSFGPGVIQLEDAEALLPQPGQGRRCRLELRPARRDEWPFRQIPAGLDPKSAFAHALASPGSGERRMVALDVRPLPPSGWSGWLRRTLSHAKGRERTERLLQDHDPLDPAERMERQREQRALWQKVGGRGNRAPLFYTQVLLEAQAPDREEGKLALSNLRGGFDQWQSENFLAAVGWRSGGSDAPWRSAWFDYRLAHGRIASDRVLAGWELAQLLIPWTRHCTSPDVVRAEPEQAQAPVEAIGAVGAAVTQLPDGRKVALTPADICRHVHLMAPTDAGKSTLLGNMLLDWVDQGLPAVLVDPGKADTVPYVLERLPRRHWERVRLIDPSRRDRSVGVNVLESRDPELHDVISDQVVSIFSQLYGQHWGPRGATIMRQGLLTLLRLPETSLGDLLPLLTDEHLRGNWLRDDPDLRQAWTSYDPREAESLIWKLKDVLSLRPAVRNLVCQRRSSIDLAQVLNGDGILLVRLPARIGPDTCSLLGRLLVARLWQVILERGVVSEGRRRHLLVAIDEFETMVQLAGAWEDFLEQARGLRAGLVLAHQHWNQLPRDIAHAVGANAKSKLAFRLEPEDAGAMAPQLRPLTATNLEHLERYQLAARLYVEGQVRPAYSGSVPPPRDPVSDGEELARGALERYGRSADEVEAETASRRGRPRLVKAPEEVLDWDR